MKILLPNLRYITRASFSNLSSVRLAMDVPDYFWEIVEEEEVKEIEEELKQGDLSAAAGKIKEQLNKINNAPLNIAITGESGSGKSTFINALRGLGDEDEGSAPTGVIETTTIPTPYPHPDLPNVQIWDLPGIGTPHFKPDEYLQQVGFDRYDVFLIISSDRFRCNDVELAMAIQKMNKNFYFVRSKIDQFRKRGKEDVLQERRNTDEDQAGLH